MARLTFLVLVFAGSVTSSWAQGDTAASPRVFEVASVRENQAVNSSPSSISGTPSRFSTSNTPLGFIILHAYDLRAHQLLDAPDWIWETAYDIRAAYPDGRTPSEGDTRMMLQALLADRFQLTVRREQRQMPVLRLVTAQREGRLGPQLVRSNVDCEKWMAERRLQTGAGGPSPVTPSGPRPACRMSVGRQGYLTGGTRTIAELAAALQSLLGRPVIDATGLSGAFDMDLRWTPNGEISAPSNGVDVGPSDAPSLVTAVQEQLGLKLEASSDAVEVLVIESVNRPTPD